MLAVSFYVILALLNCTSYHLIGLDHDSQGIHWHTIYSLKCALTILMIKKLGIMLNEVLKVCEKWYLLMWRSIKSTRSKRSGSCILQIFIRSTFKTWNTCNVKRVCIFQLILVGILSILILSVKNRGGGLEGGGGMFA